MHFRFRRRRRGAPAQLTAHDCRCSGNHREFSITLDQTHSGDVVRICCLEGEGRVVRRLSEMGFIPGTVVHVVRRAPLADPIEYQIRGYLVTLRREEAALVRVQPANGMPPSEPSDLVDTEATRAPAE